MFVARQRRCGPISTGSRRRRERALGVDRGDDRARGDLGAVGEHHAGRAVTLDPDLDDLGPRADLGAEPTGRVRERLGERARAAAGDRRLPGRPAVVAGRIREQHRRRAGRPRPHRRVLDGPGRDRPPHRVALERLGDVVGDRHRQRARRLPARLLAEPAERVPELHAVQRVGERRVLHVRRGDRVQVGQERRERPHLPVELGVRLGVRRRTLAQLGGRARRVRPQRERRTLRLGREHADLGLHRHEPLLDEPQVGDHRLPEPPDRVDDPRRPNARGELDGVEDPADAVALLQDQDGAAGLREVGGRGEAVVARADHDRVEPLRHQATLPAELPAFPPRSSSAAIRPGAPMIPPPGCVAEPHIHRSLIGVR